MSFTLPKDVAVRKAQLVGEFNRWDKDAAMYDEMIDKLLKKLRADSH